MTRAEVVKGLSEVIVEEQAHVDQCHDHRGRHARRASAIRAAISLLTPPTTEEIEAARKWAARHPDTYYHTSDGQAVSLGRVFNRALDALACEPATEAVLHRKNCRIASLEARLARVRDAVSQYRREEWARKTLDSSHRRDTLADRIDAALADQEADHE
jgi:hypothetical protein